MTGLYSLDTTRFLKCVLPEKESLAQHTVGVLFGSEHQHSLSLSNPVRKARCKGEPLNTAHSLTQYNIIQ